MKNTISKVNSYVIRSVQYCLHNMLLIIFTKLSTDGASLTSVPFYDISTLLFGIMSYVLKTCSKVSHWTGFRSSSDFEKDNLVLLIRIKYITNEGGLRMLLSHYCIIA